MGWIIRDLIWKKVWEIGKATQEVAESVVSPIGMISIQNSERKERYDKAFKFEQLSKLLEKKYGRKIDVNIERTHSGYQIVIDNVVFFNGSGEECQAFLDGLTIGYYS